MCSLAGSLGLCRGAWFAPLDALPMPDSTSESESEEGSLNIGYNSSGASEEEFVGCESRSGSEADDEAEAVVDDQDEAEESENENENDGVIRCGLCEGELLDLADTEFAGECDGGCGRTLSEARSHALVSKERL